jgi:hypothetical protein
MYFTPLSGAIAKVLVFLSVGLSAQATDPVILKTGREILASFASMTGVSDQDPEIVELYRMNAGRLSKQGLPSEFSNNGVLAVTELGGLFCKKAVQREKNLEPSVRNLFGAVDFSESPLQFDEERKVRLLGDLAGIFWQREVSESETKVLSVALDNIVKASAGGSTETERVAQILCTTFATSLGSLIR